ncbi:hypothetical protein [Pseudonocardia spirodelae]|uniref:Uncharacterized protein n=1 Tax=Pseudonocardia spirodelae TaxID=3133431 RepID=A0ABU8TAS4_9PSEU
MHSGWNWDDAAVALLLAATLCGAGAGLRAVVPLARRVPAGGVTGSALVVALAAALLLRDRPGLQVAAVVLTGVLAAATSLALRRHGRAGDGRC